MSKKTAPICVNLRLIFSLCLRVFVANSYPEIRVNPCQSVSKITVPIRVNSWLIKHRFRQLHKWGIAKWPGGCGRSFCRCLHRTKIRTKTPKLAKNKSASICVNLRLIFSLCLRVFVANSYPEISEICG